VRYMLLIHADPDMGDALTPEESAKVAGEYVAFTQELVDSGELLGGDPLQGTDTATTIRLRAGEPVPSDGPFAETKEYLCGYYLVECADLDRAIELAGRVPGMAMGSVEVRPVLPMAMSATNVVNAAASGEPS
jgi:hypothetical protein